MTMRTDYRILRAVTAQLSALLAFLKCEDPAKEILAEDPSGPAEPDPFAKAEAAGLVKPSEFVGLGYALVQSCGVGQLTLKTTRAGWVTAFVLESNDPPSILVTRIAIDGAPVMPLGDGAPLSLFTRASRFGLQFGRRFVPKDSVVLVEFTNLDLNQHGVSGAYTVDSLITVEERDEARSVEATAVDDLLD